MNARIEQDNDGTAILTFPHLGVALIIQLGSTYLKNLKTGETKLVTHVGNELHWIAFLQETYENELKSLLSDVREAVNA